MLNKILGHHTGHAVEKIERESDRDFYMSAAEAKAYSLVDEVILPPEKSSEKDKKPAEAKK
jgi:ATP-dependent Clp protease protease subunit